MQKSPLLQPSAMVYQWNSVSFAETPCGILCAVREEMPGAERWHYFRWKNEQVNLRFS